MSSIHRSTSGRQRPHRQRVPDTRIAGGEASETKATLREIAAVLAAALGVAASTNLLLIALHIGAP